jgi:hypothetical protein
MNTSAAIDQLVHLFVREWSAWLGAEMGCLEIARSSRRVGQGREQSLQLLRGRCLWILTVSAPDVAECGKT